MVSTLDRADQPFGKDGNRSTHAHHLDSPRQGLFAVPGDDRDLVDNPHESTKDRHRKGSMRDADTDRFVGYQVNQKRISGAGVVGSNDDRSFRQLVQPADVNMQHQDGIQVDDPPAKPVNDIFNEILQKNLLNEMNF